MKLSIINVSYENEILHEGYGKQLGVAPGVPTMKGAYGDPENTKRGYKSIIDTLGNHDVPQGWIQTPKPNTTPNTNPGPPVSWNDPSNPDDPQTGYGYIPNDTTKEETFFYHSDHLGSTSYITDDKANITQYDAYLPYGELLIDEHSSSEDLPYKFNGKQFDEETGLYYYGARYLNPMASIWYGVDPMQEKNTRTSTYTYTLGNPIKFVDSTGMDGEVTGNGTKESPFVIHAEYYYVKSDLKPDEVKGLELAINEYNNNGTVYKVPKAKPIGLNAPYSNNTLFYNLDNDNPLYVRFDLRLRTFNSSGELNEALERSIIGKDINNMDVRFGNKIKIGMSEVTSGNIPLGSDGSYPWCIELYRNGIENLLSHSGYSKDIYRALFVHEIGHNLGLIHPETNFRAGYSDVFYTQIMSQVLPNFANTQFKMQNGFSLFDNNPHVDTGGIALMLSRIGRDRGTRVGLIMPKE